MSRYRVEQRVLIVRTYWKTGSIIAWQWQFMAHFGVRKQAAKYSSQYLGKKLGTTGSLLDVHEGHPKLLEATVQEIKKNRLLASTRSYCMDCHLKWGGSPNTSERAAKSAKLHAYLITVMQECEKKQNYCNARGLCKHAVMIIVAISNSVQKIYLAFIAPSLHQCS